MEATKVKIGGEYLVSTSRSGGYGYGHVMRIDGHQVVWTSEDARNAGVSTAFAMRVNDSRTLKGFRATNVRDQRQHLVAARYIKVEAGEHAEKVRQQQAEREKREAENLATWATWDDRAAHIAQAIHVLELGGTVTLPRPPTEDSRRRLSAPTNATRVTVELGALVELLVQVGMLDQEGRYIGEDTRACVECGEPCVLDDPSDLESWCHAPWANDRADHTAVVDVGTYGEAED